MAAASYRVTAPYVTLKVKDTAGAEVLVGFYEGAIVSDVDQESLDSHVEKGLLEKVPAAEAKAAAGAEGTATQKRKPAKKAAAKKAEPAEAPKTEESKGD